MYFQIMSMVGQVGPQEIFIFFPTLSSVYFLFPHVFLSFFDEYCFTPLHQWCTCSLFSVVLKQSQNIECVTFYI